MADLGLCLHQSSSGLDLPMKLADLRGAGVPVAVYDYAPVLGEVMTTGQEGVTFRDPGDLASLLVSVATRSIAPDSPLGEAARGCGSIRPSAGARSGTPPRVPSYPVTPSTDRSWSRATPGSLPRPRADDQQHGAVATSVIGSRGPISNS